MERSCLQPLPLSVKSCTSMAGGAKRKHPVMAPSDVTTVLSGTTTMFAAFAAILRLLVVAVAGGVGTVTVAETDDRWQSVSIQECGADWTDR